MNNRILKNISSLVIATLIVVSCGNSSNNNEGQPQEIKNQIDEISFQEDDCPDEFIKTIEAYSFTELGLACRKGDLNSAKNLIERGACKNRCMSDEIFEYDVLYTSVMFDKIDIVKYFINTEKDVNKVYDENGMTLLTLACMRDKSDISFHMSKLLLDAGANVNGGGDMGFDYILYPLFEAIKNNNLRLVELLIDNGADITIVDKQDETIFTIIDGYGVNFEMKDYINSLRIEEE